MIVKRNVCWIALPLLTLFGTSVQAEDSYFGASLNMIEYTEDGSNESLDFMSATATLGQKFNENIKGEMRFGIGINGDQISGIDFDISNYFGMYIKAGAALNEQLFPYAILGYTRGKLTASANGAEFSDSESGSSMGFGVDFSVNSETTLNLEYLNYLDGDEWALSGLSFGVSQSF